MAILELPWVLPNNENATVEVDVLPCPFCGKVEWLVFAGQKAEGKFSNTGKRLRWPSLGLHVRCLECGATGPSGFSSGDGRSIPPEAEVEVIGIAVAQWNCRSDISGEVAKTFVELLRSARALVMLKQIKD